MIEIMMETQGYLNPQNKSVLSEMKKDFIKEIGSL
jgi:hypothetical protein